MTLFRRGVSDDDDDNDDDDNDDDDIVANAGCVQQNVLLAGSPGPQFQYWMTYDFCFKPFYSQKNHMTRSQ